MNVVIVGCQNGDEGKGKFTDYFASPAGAVVRYQGGPHTGHTVETDTGRYKFIQVPSGAARGATCFLGNGCVIDPPALVEELARLNEQLPSPIKLVISPRAHVVLPHHRAMDVAMETWRGAAIATSGATGFNDGSGQLGSTKRGVGPCREDKIARIGLRMVDLLDAASLEARLERLLPLKRRILEAIVPEWVPETGEEWDVRRLAARYHGAARSLAVYLGDVSSGVLSFQSRGLPIVFEGAQSVALDVEHGTYPYCSSGYSSAGGVFVGTGLPPTFPVRVYGVMKAYATKVGGGPLPTELHGRVGEEIRRRGKEYGTVTGRARRVGWLDLCYVRRAILLDGICGLCVSSLDVLGGLEEVRVCTHYEGVQRLDEYPVSVSSLADVSPAFHSLAGWPEIAADAVVREGTSALPAGARSYLDFLQQALAVPVVAVGVGPSRYHTVALTGP